MSSSTTFKNRNIELDSLKTVFISSELLQINSSNVDLGQTKLKFNSNTVVVGDASQSGTVGAITADTTGTAAYNQLIKINVNGVNYLIPAKLA